MKRRDLISAAAFATLGLGTVGSDSVAAVGGNIVPAARIRQPRLRFLYECEVTLAATIDFGDTLEGHRRIIPIAGGRFSGPRLRGRVLAIGADWNLTRRDGASSVEAAYYLQTDDQVTIRIVNTGVGAPATADSGEEHFYMFTQPRFEAPRGKYDWLNRSIFVGTLGARGDAHDAVIIRVFQVV